MEAITIYYAYMDFVPSEKACTISIRKIWQSGVITALG